MGEESRAYAIRCHYRSGGAEARLAVRLEHLEFMIAALPITVFGGALLSEGGKPIGMEVIIRAADLETARAFIGPEPYYRTGVFASVVIERVRPMTPPYDGAPLHEQLAVERARRG